MQFLSPWTALIAAAIALPALLLLYFLKLRRATLRIPSTLLWRKSFEDLQVNAPFQRLRWSLLLLLQLLMLAALLLALSEPLWRDGGGSAASRVVLIIDRSASMNAPVIDDQSKPGEPRLTRFEAAKQAAIDIIDSMGERGGPSQAMLIGFGAHAQVISAFESNRGVLRDAVNAITPTDEQSNLEAALDLASAFAGNRDESSEQSATSSAPPPEVVLLSDGNVATAGDRTAFSLRAGEFRFIQVAGSAPESSTTTAPTTSPINNLGIVALGARRDYEDPARVIIFARLLNAGDLPVDAVLTVAVDARPVTTIRARVPAAIGDVVNGGGAGAAGAIGGGGGEIPISHALDLPGGGVVTLQHNHSDDLSADDVAAIIVPPPSKPRIALVHPADSPPDAYLNELLLAMEPDGVQSIAFDQWSQIDPATIDSASRFDMVVFDRITGARFPGIPSLTFGGVPAGLTIAADGGAESQGSSGGGGGQPIMSWDRQHPVMRHLALDSIVYSGFTSLELPETNATPLAWGPTGPVIALVRTRGARHVIVGFALRKSNWSLHVSSAMFIQNALEFLTLSGGSQNASGSSGQGLAFKPGEAITVRAKPGATSIIVEGNGRSAEMKLPPIDDGSSVSPLVTLPPISRAGLYSVSGALPPNEFVAVSVLSDIESDIRPRDSITVNAEAAQAKANAGKDQPLPLWPWLLAAALALAVLEWLAYCRRVR